MASEEPGLVQKYAIQARKWIAMLRTARPDVAIEILWCPAYQGVVGNEKADEWAKLAAEEPDAHGCGTSPMTTPMNEAATASSMATPVKIS